MLIRQKQKEYNKLLLNKIQDKELFNKKILELYIKEELYKYIDIMDCLTYNNITFDFFKDVYKYIQNDELYKRKQISLIINKNEFKSEEVTDFLINTVSKDIGLNDLFDYMYLYDSLFLKKKTNRIFQFEEKDIKKIFDFSKEKNIDVGRMLSTQKNIDFILNSSLGEKNIIIENNLIKHIIVNPNLSSEFMDKFLNLYSNNMEENDFSTINQYWNLNVDLIKKYPNIFNLNRLYLNKNINEEIIKEFLLNDKTSMLNIKNIDVSKKFLKDNIDVVSYDLVFNNLDNEKEYERFIELLLTNEVKQFEKNQKQEPINQKISKVLSSLNESKKLDYGFYDKIYKKYNVIDDNDKFLLFNENTSEKYFGEIEEFLSGVDIFIEKGITTDFITSKIKHLIKYVNIPEKIISKYYKSLQIDEKNKISYDLLIKNQMLPQNIKNNENFLKQITNKTTYEEFIKKQISSTKELNSFLNNDILKNYNDNIRNKENYLKEILCENNIYLSQIENNDKLIDMIKNFNNDRDFNFNFNVLFLVMENNKLNKGLTSKIKIDYGYSF